MISSNLISQIHKMKETRLTQNVSQPVASINISDVEEGAPLRFEDEPIFRFKFLNNLFDKIKKIILKKRIEKLENISPEKITPNQKAELEANKLSLDYML